METPETTPKKRILNPVNQKSLYHTFADLYGKIINDDISIEKGEVLCKALCGMNSVYANEIKRAKVENREIRVVEIKNFEDANDKLLSKPE